MDNEPATSRHGASGRCYRIVRVGGDLRIQAAKRLLGPGRGDSQSAIQMLQAAESHGIDISNLWATVDQNRESIRQVCLLVEGSGRSAMVFTSAPIGREQEAELAELLRQITASLRSVHLVQALLEVDERGARAALLESGFLSVGTLAYMRRPTRPNPDQAVSRVSEIQKGGWPDGLILRRYESGDDDALIEGLERTYEGTLDCPELCGLRRTCDVLESHRATGRWDPDLWWLLEKGGRIEGMLLLNPCPDTGTIELVYLGLAPSLRGHGLGHRLLAHAMADVRGRSEPFVTCAVDERNQPAMRLYRSAGFSEFARRIALVKPVRTA